MTPEQIRAAFAAAVAELSQAKEGVQLVIGQLQEGVDIGIAYGIIDRYWDGSDAQQLKVQMTNTFPKQNGEAILSAPFSEKLGIALSFPEVRNYLDMVFPAIVQRVKAVYDELNAADLNNEEALAAFNVFRQQPVKFLDLLDGMVWSDRERLLKNEFANWSDIPCDTKRVENGDYLFLNDYKADLEKAKTQVITDLFGDENSDYTPSMWSVENLSDRIRVKVMLAEMFFNSLESLPVGE